MSILQVLFSSYKPYDNLPDTTDHISKAFINGSYNACVTIVNISPEKSASFRKLCALEAMLLLIAYRLPILNDKHGSMAFLIGLTLEESLKAEVKQQVRASKFSSEDRIRYYQNQLQKVKGNPKFLASGLIYPLYENPLVSTVSNDEDGEEYIEMSQGVIIKDLAFVLKFMQTVQEAMGAMKQYTFKNLE